MGCEDVAEQRVAFVNDTSPSLHFGCRAVVEQFEQLAYRLNVKLSPRLPVDTDFVSALKNSPPVDAMWINGEGTLHHDRPAVRRLTAAITWDPEQKIPVCVLNAVAECLPERTLEALRNVRVLVTRDPCSAAYLQSQGFTVGNVPDLSLLTEPRPWRQRSGVIWTDSIVAETSLRLWSDAKQRGDRMLRLTAPPIAPGGDRPATRAWVRRLFPLKERLWPIIGQSCSFLPSGLRSQALSYADCANDLGELLEVFASARVVIAGRFHAACLSLVQRTPFLAVASNSHKMQGLLEEFGLQHRFVNLEDLSDEKIDSASRWTDEEIQSVDQIFNDLPARVQAVGDQLAKVLAT